MPIDSECVGDDSLGTLACNHAAHTMCAALECFNSGLPPASGHSGSSESWISSLPCVSGDVRTLSFDDLNEFDASCDGVVERVGERCNTAIHRYCVDNGAVSGFGPVAIDGDTTTITCVTAATLVTLSIEELSSLASRCVPNSSTCSVAAFSYCELNGHAGGYGPVEIDGDSATIVCLDR